MKQQPSRCPNCGVDAFLLAVRETTWGKSTPGAVHRCPPAPGDLTVCPACAAILTFGPLPKLKLAFLPPEVEPPVHAARLQHAMHQAWAWQARRNRAAAERAAAEQRARRQE